MDILVFATVIGGLYTLYLIAAFLTRRMVTTGADAIPVLERKYLGRTGTTVTHVDENTHDPGYIDLENEQGDIHRIACITLKGQPELGRNILVKVVDHDPEKDLFVVKRVDVTWS